MTKKIRYSPSQQPGQSASDTALLLSLTDFRDEQAASEALQQAEQAIQISGEDKIQQAGHRLIHIIRIYHLAVSNGDKQFFGYALQKAFREWMSARPSISFT